jgi:hypothetical protein
MHFLGLSVIFFASFLARYSNASCRQISFCSHNNLSGLKLKKCRQTSAVAFWQLVEALDLSVPRMIKLANLEFAPLPGF